MDIEAENKKLKLEAFRYKMLLNARSLIVHLSNENIPIEDFLAYMDRRMKVREPYGKEAPPLPTRICGDCVSSMTLFEVNISKATMTGDLTDKSVWLCSDKKCMNTIYNKETAQEIIKSGGT